MADISALAQGATGVQALSGLLLATPQQNVGYQAQNQPTNVTNPTVSTPVQQPPTFVFNYEGEQIVILESDITDHYIEDNTAIQDQISLKPEVFTTHGFIGELTDIVPPILAPLKLVANKLTNLGAYTPVLSAAALIALNEAVFAYSIALNVSTSVIAALNSFSKDSQNKQQKAYNQLYGYWLQRTLFTVQTPWNIFTDMVIQTMRVVQSQETNTVSEFQLTFKKMKFAFTLSQIATGGWGRYNSQSAPLSNLGTVTPVEATTSLQSGITQMVG